MRTKAFIVLTATGLLVFLVVTAVSYFLRSDGFGLPGVQDGIIRVGFPFLMLEIGGFEHREHLSVSALIGNLLVTVLITGIAVAIVYPRKRAHGPDSQRRVSDTKGG